MYHSHSDDLANTGKLIIGLIGVIILVIGIVFNKGDSKRRADFFALLKRLNLSFNRGPDYEIPNRFGFLRGCNQDDTHWACNVLSGAYQNYDVLVFDYTYSTAASRPQKIGVFILTMPGSTFPHITISNDGENFSDSVAGLAGSREIRFESADFSKAFHVRCEDKKFAYDVCNPQMMRHLLANRDFSVEIANDVVALVFEGKLVYDRFESLESNLQQLVKIRSLMPDYLFTKEPV